MRARWAEEIADRCDAAVERYHRADLQLEDVASVQLETTLLRSTAGQSDPYEPAVPGSVDASKAELRKFYARVIADLGGKAQSIRNHLAKPDTVPWKSLLDGGALMGELMVDLLQSRKQTALFVESSVALILARRPFGQDRYLKVRTLVPPSFVRHFKVDKPSP